MQLKIHNEGWVYFVISCLITIIIIPFYTILGILLCILSAYIFYFFRDPVRSIPGEKVIVSPADGLVTFIGITKNPLNDETDQNSYKKISIFLSVFDVHVNRMPVDAKISQIKYIPGKFINATLDKSSEENERNYYKVKLSNGEDIVLVQIAGLIARRIVCEVEQGQNIKQGERVGMIRFGSRVDVYFKNKKVLAKLGQNVVAGESLIASE